MRKLLAWVCTLTLMIGMIGNYGVVAATVGTTANTIVARPEVMPLDRTSFFLPFDEVGLEGEAYYLGKTFDIYDIDGTTTIGTGLVVNDSVLGIGLQTTITGTLPLVGGGIYSADSTDMSITFDITASDGNLVVLGFDQTEFEVFNTDPTASIVHRVIGYGLTTTAETDYLSNIFSAATLTTTPSGSSIDLVAGESVDGLVVPDFNADTYYDVLDIAVDRSYGFEEGATGTLDFSSPTSSFSVPVVYNIAFPVPTDYSTMTVTEMDYQNPLVITDDEYWFNLHMEDGSFDVMNEVIVISADEQTTSLTTTGNIYNNGGGVYNANLSFGSVKLTAGSDYYMIGEDTLGNSFRMPFSVADYTLDLYPELPANRTDFTVRLWNEGFAEEPLVGKTVNLYTDAARTTSVVYAEGYSAPSVYSNEDGYWIDLHLLEGLYEGNVLYYDIDGSLTNVRATNMDKVTNNRKVIDYGRDEFEASRDGQGTTLEFVNYGYNLNDVGGVTQLRIEDQSTDEVLLTIDGPQMNWTDELLTEKISCSVEKSVFADFSENTIRVYMVYGDGSSQYFVGNVQLPVSSSAVTLPEILTPDWQEPLVVTSGRTNIWYNIEGPGAGYIRNLEFHAYDSNNIEVNLGYTVSEQDYQTYSEGNGRFSAWVDFTDPLSDAYGYELLAIMVDGTTRPLEFDVLTTAYHVDPWSVPYNRSIFGIRLDILGDATGIDLTGTTATFYTDPSCAQGTEATDLVDGIVVKDATDGQYYISCSPEAPITASGQWYYTLSGIDQAALYNTNKVTTSGRMAFLDFNYQLLSDSCNSGDVYSFGITGFFDDPAANLYTLYITDEAYNHLFEVPTSALSYHQGENYDSMSWDLDKTAYASIAGTDIGLQIVYINDGGSYGWSSFYVGENSIPGGETDIQPIQVTEVHGNGILNGSTSLDLKLYGYSLESMASVEVYNTAAPDTNLVSSLNNLTFNLYNSNDGWGRLDVEVTLSEAIADGNTYKVVVTNDSVDEPYTYEFELIHGVYVYELFSDWLFSGSESTMTGVNITGNDAFFLDKHLQFYSDASMASGTEVAATGDFYQDPDSGRMDSLVNRTDSLAADDVWYYQLLDSSNVAVTEAVTPRSEVVGKDYGFLDIYPEDFEMTALDDSSDYTEFTFKGYGFTSDLSGLAAETGGTFFIGDYNDDTFSYDVIANLSKGAYIEVTPYIIDDVTYANMYTIYVPKNAGLGGDYQFETYTDYYIEYDTDYSGWSWGSFYVEETATPEPFSINWQDPTAIPTGEQSFELYLNGWHLDTITDVTLTSTDTGINFIYGAPSLDVDQNGWSDYRLPVSFNKPIETGYNYTITVVTSGSGTITLPFAVNDYVYALSDRAVPINDTSFAIKVDVWGDWDQATTDLVGAGVNFYNDADMNSAATDLPTDCTITQDGNMFVVNVDLTTAITEDKTWYYSINGVDAAWSMRPMKIYTYGQTEMHLLDFDRPTIEASINDTEAMDYLYVVDVINPIDVASFDSIELYECTDGDPTIYTVPLSQITINNMSYYDQYVITLPKVDNTDLIGKDVGVRFTQGDSDWGIGGVYFYEPATPEPFSIKYQDPIAVPSGSWDFGLNLSGWQLDTITNLEIVTDNPTIGFNYVDQGLNTYEDGWSDYFVKIGLTEAIDPAYTYEILVTTEDSSTYTLPLGVYDYVYSIEGNAVPLNTDKFAMKLSIWGDLNGEDLSGKTVNFYSDESMTTLAEDLPSSAIEKLQDDYIIKMDLTGSPITEEKQWYYKIEGVSLDQAWRENVVYTHDRFTLLALDKERAIASMESTDNTNFEFGLFGVNLMDVNGFDSIELRYDIEGIENSESIDLNNVSIEYGEYYDEYILTLPKVEYSHLLGEDVGFVFYFPDHEWGYGSIYVYEPQPLSVYDLENKGFLVGWDEFGLTLSGFWLGELDQSSVWISDDAVPDTNLIAEFYDYGFDQHEESGWGHLNMNLRLSQPLLAGHLYTLSVDNGLTYGDPDYYSWSVELPVRDLMYGFDTNSMPLNSTQGMATFDAYGNDAYYNGMYIQFYADEEQQSPVDAVGTLYFQEGMPTMILIEGTATLSENDVWYYQLMNSDGTANTEAIANCDNVFRPSSAHIAYIDNSSFEATGSNTSEAYSKFTFVGHGINSDFSNMNAVYIGRRDDDSFRYDIATSDADGLVTLADGVLVTTEDYIVDNTTYATIYTISIPKNEGVGGDYTFETNVPYSLNLESDTYGGSWSDYVTYPYHDFEILGLEPKAWPAIYNDMNFTIKGYQMDQIDSFELLVTDASSNPVDLGMTVNDQWVDTDESGVQYFRANLSFTQTMSTDYDYELVLTLKDATVINITVPDYNYVYGLDYDAVALNRSKFLIYFNHWGQWDDGIIGKTVHFYEDAAMTVQSTTLPATAIISNTYGRPAIAVDLGTESITSETIWYYSIDDMDPNQMMSDPIISTFDYKRIVGFDDQRMYNNMIDSSIADYEVVAQGYNLPDPSTVTAILYNPENGAEIMTATSAQFTLEFGEYVDSYVLTFPKADYTDLINTNIGIRLNFADGSECSMDSFYVPTPRITTLTMADENQPLVVRPGGDVVAFFIEGYCLDAVTDYAIYATADSNKTNLVDLTHEVTSFNWNEMNGETGYEEAQFIMWLSTPLQEGVAYSFEMTDGTTIITQNITVTNNTVYIIAQGFVEGLDPMYMEVRAVPSSTVDLAAIVGETVNISSVIDQSDTVATGVVTAINGNYYIAATPVDGVYIQSGQRLYVRFNNPAIFIEWGEQAEVFPYYIGELDGQILYNSMYGTGPYTFTLDGTYIPAAVDFTEIYLFTGDVDSPTIVYDIKAALEASTAGVTYTVTDVGGIDELTIELDQALLADPLISYSDLQIGFKNDALYTTRGFGFNQPVFIGAGCVAADKFATNPFITIVMEDMNTSVDHTMILYPEGGTEADNIIGSIVGYSLVGEDENGNDIYEYEVTLTSAIQGDTTYVIIIDDSVYTLEGTLFVEGAFVPDYDKSGTTDTADLDLMAEEYGTDETNAKYSTLVDLNEDGVVDLYDLMELAKQIQP